MKRTIAIFTGNRAEYGLQLPILRAIKDHPDLDYRLLVSGAHLDEDFGRTIDEISADGFDVYAEIKVDMPADSAIATARAIGSTVLSLAPVLAEINPHYALVYADRFEGFGAVIASSQMNIPTAHVEGGDLTEGGALDDSVRHAMTKCAHLHFTTNQQASNRILGMGEEDWRVHTVGLTALDLVAGGNFASPQELASSLNLDLTRPVVVFTQHSITTDIDQASRQIRQSLAGIQLLAAAGIQVIVTYPNNDAGGKQIIAELEAFFLQPRVNMQLHRSLGRYRYHGLLALAKVDGIRVACVGNSSSGIKETPVFGCPTVNVGTRQQGRLRGANVIDSGYEPEAIESAVNACLFDENFRNVCRTADNPYGLGDAGRKIADVLATLPYDRHRLLTKKMTLRGEARDGWFR